MENNKNLLKSLFVLFGFALFCAPTFGMKNINELGNDRNYDSFDDIIEDYVPENNDTKKEIVLSNNKNNSIKQEEELKSVITNMSQEINKESNKIIELVATKERQKKIYDRLIEEMRENNSRNVIKHYSNIHHVSDLIKNMTKEKDFDVNYQDEQGDTLLFNALEIKGTLGLELVNFFVTIGANLKIRDREGNTPLMLACKEANLSCIEFLINSGDNINNQNKNGDTPLNIMRNKLILMRWHPNNTPPQLPIIKMLLYNNAKFTKNDTIYSSAQSYRINEPFDQIISFNEDTKDNALERAVNNINTQFIPSQWLTYALLNNRIKQIKYYINNNDQALLAWEILSKMAHKKNIPLTMFDSLWTATENSDQEDLESQAYKNKHKLFLSAITQYKLITKELSDINIFYKN